VVLGATPLLVFSLLMYPTSSSLRRWVIRLPGVGSLGPDPLHPAAVLGLDPQTAVRYADNARQLVGTAAGTPCSTMKSGSQVKESAGKRLLTTEEENKRTGTRPPGTVIPVGERGPGPCASRCC
jgi:hypothetical protein